MKTRDSGGGKVDIARETAFANLGFEKSNNILTHYQCVPTNIGINFIIYITFGTLVVVN